MDNVDLSVVNVSPGSVLNLTLPEEGLACPVAIRVADELSQRSNRSEIGAGKQLPVGCVSGLEAGKEIAEIINVKDTASTASMQERKSKDPG
jgi:hypothetical protein